MQYSYLGKTGLSVSRLCFGCMSYGETSPRWPWVLGFDEGRPMFRKAWEAGINFYDTANVYADGTSEEITGKLLRELGSRDEYVLATKAFFPMRLGPNGSGLSRKALLSEIDHSLRRLGTDYVDLYQIHRVDPHTSFEETMDALNDVVRAGKARYIGASSMYAWQFLKFQAAAEKAGGAKFVSMQNNVSLVYREEEREMLPLCALDGIGVIPWSPLAAGLLARPWGGTGSIRNTQDPFAKSMYEDPTGNDREVVEALSRLSDVRGVSMAQLALAWLLHKNVVTAPILGATKMGHLEDALAALDVSLSAEEIARLEAAYKPRANASFE